MNSSEKPRQFFLNWPVQLARFLKIYNKFLFFKTIDYPIVDEQKKAVLFSIWHEAVLTLLGHFGHYGHYILSSLSNDGDFITTGAKYLGFKAIRGSSSKGGTEALFKSFQRLNQGGNSLIYTVDGPRGPRRIAKPGIALVAAKSGIPIHYVGVAVSHKIVLKKSWDKQIIPLPFSKIVAYFSPPNYLSAEVLSWDRKKLSDLITEGNNEATKEAEIILAKWKKRI